MKLTNIQCCGLRIRIPRASILEIFSVVDCGSESRSSISEIFCVMDCGSGSRSSILVNGVRIQFRIRIKGFLTKMCKMLKLKKSFFWKKFIFLYPEASVKSKLQGSLQSSKNKKQKQPALHKMKCLHIFNFVGHFFPPWIWTSRLKCSSINTSFKNCFSPYIGTVCFITF